jgi:hypothetical protein
LETLLVGNGIDIEFGGKEYYNCNIINRAVANIETGKFNQSDYPSNFLLHFNQLFQLAKQIISNPRIVKGKAWDEADKISLEGFLIRYSKQELISVDQIGFEDYFLIQKLFFNINYDSKIGNSKEREVCYDCLRRFFWDAIYNDGKINKIEYPIKLKDYFNEFDNVFSLNYDNNIEKLIDKEIYHLHGAFDILDEKYTNNSQMNKMMDVATDIVGREYLYSTALTNYCGNEKEKSLNQADNINKFLKTSLKFKAECIRTNTPLSLKLQRIINAYEKSPNYIYPQNYCYEQFKSINGSLTMIGLFWSKNCVMLEKFKKVC